MGVVVLGLALIIPKLGITALGEISWTGIISCVVPIVLLIIGIEAIIRKYKK